MSIKKSNIADIASATLFAVLAIILFFVNNPQPSNVGSKEVAKVLSVDNSQIQKVGLLLMGSQMLEVEVCSGKYVGEKLKAGNTLRAQMDLDKVFVVGDEIIVAIPAKFNPQKDIINAQDYNRTSKAVWLFILFSVLLVCFAGFTGAKALLSFVFAFMFIWKVVVPACLSGVNAILICFVAVAILTAAGVVFAPQTAEDVMALGDHMHASLYSWGTSAEKLEEVENFFDSLRLLNFGGSGDDVPDVNKNTSVATKLYMKLILDYFKTGNPRLLELIMRYSGSNEQEITPGEAPEAEENSLIAALNRQAEEVWKNEGQKE